VLHGAGLRADCTSVRRWLLLGAALLLGISVVFVARRGFSLIQTSTPPSTQVLAAGTLVLSLSGTGASDLLSVGADNLIAGSAAERAVELVNSGTVPIGTITMSVQATPENQLASSPAFTIEVQTCSSTWNATPLSDGGYEYACSGTPTTVVQPTAVASLGSPVVLSSTPLAPQASLVAVITMGLTPAATSAVANQNVTLHFSFTGTQEPGGPA